MHNNTLAMLSLKQNRAIIVIGKQLNEGDHEIQVNIRIGVVANKYKFQEALAREGH